MQGSSAMCAFGSPQELSTHRGNNGSVLRIEKHKVKELLSETRDDIPGVNVKKKRATQTSLICGNESSQTWWPHADRYLVGGMSSVLSRSFTSWGMLQLERYRPLPLASAQASGSTFLGFWCKIKQPWDGITEPENSSRETRSYEFCVPLRQQWKGTLLFLCLGVLFFTSQENPPTLLMCPVERNHVHLCIIFRLDLNGTLPPLTLGSVAPDKLICGGLCPPRPPRKSRDLASFLPRPTVSTLPLLTPNDPHSGRSRRILLMFFFISSEQQTQAVVGCGAGHRTTPRRPWTPCSNLYSQQVMLICCMAGKSLI